jgi:hypothetical protein
MLQQRECVELADKCLGGDHQKDGEINFHLDSSGIREGHRELIRERLQGGYCPLRAASLLDSEASTVAFFLARLPGR